jgi:hypothetical protein
MEGATTLEILELRDSVLVCAVLLTRHGFLDRFPGASVVLILLQNPIDVGGRVT